MKVPSIPNKIFISHLKPEFDEEIRLELKKLPFEVHALKEGEEFEI